MIRGIVLGGVDPHGLTPHGPTPFEQCLQVSDDRCKTEPAERGVVTLQIFYFLRSFNPLLAYKSGDLKKSLGNNSKMNLYSEKVTFGHR